MTSQVPGHALVELSGVSKSYPGGVVAMRDVNLRIGYGELVAIVGPSGSGKSTMLHVMGPWTGPRPGGSASTGGTRQP